MLESVLFASMAVLVALGLVWYVFGVREAALRPHSLAGKRVLITGAASGIGEQIAYCYSRLGASLLITARREQLLRQVAIKCEALGAQQVGYVVADMTLVDDRIRLVEEARRRLDGRLDHLILNHGIMSAYLWTGSDDNMALLHEQMATNFFSYVELVGRCSDMLKASKGNIGIVSSGAAKISFAFVDSYAATKFALEGFFVAYREELRLSKSGVSLTIAYPGAIDTGTANSILRQTFGPRAGELLPAASAVRCASVIVAAVTRRKRDVIFPFNLRILLFAHKIAPDILVAYISKLQYSWWARR